MHLHWTKNEVFIKDFFSKCDQIRNFLQIWSHLLKKALMENFIFCAVKIYLTVIWLLRHCKHYKFVYLKNALHFFEQTCKMKTYYCTLTRRYPFLIFSGVRLWLISFPFCVSLEKANGRRNFWFNFSNFARYVFFYRKQYSTSNP